MHRFGLRYASMQARIAAFLVQPIIFTAHHTDCAHGLDLFRSLADACNSIGTVLWTGARAMTESNYMTMASGETLRIRSFSNRIVVKRDAHVKQIVIGMPGRSEVRIDCNTSPQQIKSPACFLSLNYSDGGGNLLEVAGVRSFVCPAEQGVAVSVWPWLRRRLCEGRDRILPYVKPQL